MVIVGGLKHEPQAHAARAGAAGAPDCLRANGIAAVGPTARAQEEFVAAAKVPA